MGNNFSLQHSPLCRTIALLLLLAIGLQLDGRPLELSVRADAAILINSDSGAILYEKNANVPHFPASTTKIATAAYALERTGGNLEIPITADREALMMATAAEKERSNYKLAPYRLEPDGSHIGIKNGEVLTLNELLFGLLLLSGNDAANVIAQQIGGTIPQFMHGVNSYLKACGCHNSTFYNPHGLHHPGHKTTAYDMAQLTRHAMKNEKFREMVSTAQFFRPKGKKEGGQRWSSTNRLLRKGGKYYYPWAIGVKTGYTAKAQNNFIAAATKDGRTLIAVLLHTKEREDIFKDAISLFDAAFREKKKRRILVKAGAQPYTLQCERASMPIPTYCQNALEEEFFPAEEREVRAFLQWEDPKLPIRKGEKIGELKIETIEGMPLYSTPLLAATDVSASWSAWLRSLWPF